MIAKLILRPKLMSIFFTSMTIFSSFEVFAQNTTFKTDLGFIKLEDPKTPQFLKNAVRSVFEVRIYADDRIEDIKVIDLSDPKLNDLENKIQLVGELDDKEKMLIIKQIKNCRANGLDKQCALFFTIEKATAFIAGDDYTLWTNAHVVDRYLKIQAALSGKTVQEILDSKPRLPLFLFNTSGELIFDPLLDTATLDGYDSPSIAAKLKFNWYAEDTDFVKIRLSKKISEALRIGKMSSPGDLLIHPGFSACTGCLKNPNITDPLLNLTRGSGKDSNGQGLWWSAGNLLTKEEAYRFYGISPSYLKSYKENQMIYFSADSQVGFSGGPILNALGEVVGVFSGSKPKADGSSFNVISRGVRPPDFDKY